MEKAKCKSCGADCYWIKTIKGKLHLVNAKKLKVFCQAVLPNPGRYLLMEGYESHFSTCPLADFWRKKK